MRDLDQPLRCIANETNGARDSLRALPRFEGI